MNSYGITETETNADPLVEEVQRLGYAVLPAVLSAETCNTARKKIDAVYEEQVKELSAEVLASIKETDMARAPLSYDPWFLSLLNLPSITSLVSQLLGKYHILNLQNGIINRPTVKHHQASWHRDLPYQSWVCSRPLGINALFCIDDFSIETGGTYVLPHSHRFETFPSDGYVQRFEQPVTAAAGSVIIFDAMLFHRAGSNTSNRIRRGINHLYTIPLFKQQISLPQALRAGDIAPPTELRRLLGFDVEEPSSVVDWRKGRLNKMPPE